jgi:hypothetical protein
MVDANVTELLPSRVNDPTNALRQQRHRKRKARSAAHVGEHGAIGD